MLNDIVEKETKTLFFMYGGNFYEMERDGVYKKYQSFKIPKNVEKSWMYEICADIEEKIKIATGYKKIQLISDYVGKLDSDTSIYFLIDYINNSTDDTFSKLLLGETLIRVRNQNQNIKNNDKEIKEISKCIKGLKEELLSKDVTIDDSYKNLYYFKDILNDEYITIRIGKLE